jgi:hypothetical protein
VLSNVTAHTRITHVAGDFDMLAAMAEPRLAVVSPEGMTRVPERPSRASVTDLNGRTICEVVDRIPDLLAAGTGPERRVAAFPDPAAIRIVAAGGHSVYPAWGYVQNHRQGPPFSKRALSRG